MVKEEPPPKPKEITPEKPKAEPPPEAPKLAQVPVVAPPPTVAAAPPPGGVRATPPTAPPAAETPAFVFEGGTTVQTTSDPVQLYKSFIEFALRANWDRPSDMADDNFVAEVEVTIDPRGTIRDPVWKRTSGDRRWDDSVRTALAATPQLERPPPTNFPPRFVVRFDVQTTSEPVLP